MEEATRYGKLRRKLCPGCPLYATCAQFPEQLEACGDAAQLIRMEATAPGRDLLRERLDTERLHTREKVGA